MGLFRNEKASLPAHSVPAAHNGVDSTSTQPSAGAVSQTDTTWGKTKKVSFTQRIKDKFRAMKAKTKGTVKSNNNRVNNHMQTGTTSVTNTTGGVSTNGGAVNTNGNK